MTPIILLDVQKPQDTYLGPGDTIDDPMLPADHPVRVLSTRDRGAELREIKQ